MSHTLRIQLPDEVYEAVVGVARTSGRTPEDVTADWVTGHVSDKPSRAADGQDQRSLEALLAFAGAWDSGDPASSDNERIDADLAREYAASPGGDR